MALVSYGVMRVSGRNIERKKDKITIVTSFYPMYIIALNLVADIDNVEVVNLTDNNIGCLHDYQLTTNDMRTLSDADILILNGGEMESFLEEVITAYPDLSVIDASEDINFLEGAEHVHGDEDHANEEDGHNHEEEHTHEDEHAHEENHHTHGTINGHVWLDMNRYLMQIDHIAHTLGEFDNDNATAYESNAKAYMQKVNERKETFEKALEPAKGNEIITFHAAFAYLADELGMEVVYALDMDSETTALSAGDIATVIDEIKLHNIKYLLAEEQYSKAVAERIALETNTTVLLLDTMVGGEVDNDAYLLAMDRNLEKLSVFFGKE